MQLISLKEVLETMEKRESPFSIAFVTLDKTKSTGGKIIRIERAMQNGSAASSIEKISAGTISTNNQSYLKSPNHYKNRTRNIRITGTNQIRKVHIRLIIEFNGKKVFY